MHPLQISSQAEFNDYLEKHLALKKTVSLSDLASGGRLNREQSRKFVDLGVDETVALKAGSGVMRINAGALRGEVDALDICGHTVRGNSEHTSTTATACDTDARKPTFGKFNYDLVKLTQDWKMSWESLQDNIEREGLRTAINTAMGRKWGNEIEELFWRGDTTTYAAGATNQALLLRTLDGIIVQALDCTNVIVCGDGGHQLTKSSTLTRDHFFYMLRNLPQRFLNNPGLTFWMHPAAADDYRYYLGTLGTNLADAHFDGPKKDFMPGGVKKVEAGWIPVDYTGTDNYIILTLDKNLWYAVYNEIRRYSRFDQHCDAFFYTNHYMFDCGIRDCDALVILTGFSLRTYA